MAITSRSELSVSKKVSGKSTTYCALDMSDESVYDMAQHYYTAEEIGQRFNTTNDTVLSLHGDAYNAGKANAFTKPRMALAKILNDFMAVDENGQALNFARPDVPVHNLLKAIELHARKYEGMGQKSEVEVSQKPVSPSDIKFTPLTLDNKDQSWT